MNVLIVGKHGQLASALVEAAGALGISASACSKEELDITNPLQIAQALDEVRPDVLINTAAFHIVGRCEEEPNEAFLLNATAVRNAARACRERNIRFVTYSTDYVFDGTKGAPYEESDAPRPLQMYGISKVAGEYAALAEHPKGSFVIRTCGVYGGKTGSPQKGGNFVLGILRDAGVSNRIEVSSDQIASPSSARDVARGTLKLLQGFAAPGMYHLVNEGQCSWYEFAAAIIEERRLPVEIVPVDRSGRSGGVLRPTYSAVANTRAKALGITLPHWRDGLKAYLVTLP